MKELIIRLHCADLTATNSSNTTTAAVAENSNHTSTNRHKHSATRGRPTKKDTVYVRDQAQDIDPVVPIVRNW